MNNFLLEPEVSSGGGRGHWLAFSLAWVFDRPHELAMDFHKHQQSQVVRLVQDHVCGAVRQCYRFVQGGLR